MKKFSLILILVLILVDCSKNDILEDPLEDACLNYIDHVYKYPAISWKDSASTENSGQRTKEALKIPEDYLKCCSTDSLIRTCLNCPYFILMWTSSDLQTAFSKAIMINCNGFDELYSRDDIGLKLIYEYRTMYATGFPQDEDTKKIIAHIMTLVNIEMTIAQYDFLNKLTEEEIILLLDECISKYKLKLAYENWGYYGIISTLCIMARIMFIADYKPFTDEIDKIYGLYGIVESATIIESEQALNTILRISENYLAELKK